MDEKATMQTEIAAVDPRPDENIKKIFCYQLISGAAVLVLAFICSLIPIVKIGSSSLGNAWQVLGNLSKILEESGQPNTLLALFASSATVLIFPMIVVLALLIVQAFDLLLCVVCRKNERFHYSMRNPIALAVVAAVLLAAAVVVGTVFMDKFSDFYSTSFSIFILLFVVFYARAAVEHILSAVLINRSPEKVKEYKRFKRIEGHIAALRMIQRLPSILLVVSFVSVLHTIPWLRSTIDFPAPVKNGTVVMEITEENANSLWNFYNREDTKQILNSGVRTTTTHAYSYDYHFYDNFIKNTEEKIDALFPKEVDAEGMQEYLETVARLREDIKIAKELRDKPQIYNEYVRYKGSYYEFARYNRWNMTAGNGGSALKWEMRDDPLEYREGEAITLTRTAFNRGTNFSKIVLCAHIDYADGSEQFTIITVKNAAELTAAAPGTHTLIFEDDWGVYGVEITIN